MSALSFKTASLEISASDDATEIFLMDANLDRIASGLGQLEKKVSPGIYKVRFRSGASQQDKLVEISSTDEQVKVQGSPILFRATAPIYETLSTHEYQSDPAKSTSRCVNQDIGIGGELFVFIRDEDEDQVFLATGITVHSIDGMELATLETGDVNFQGRWGALNLRLDPGTYRIRVASARVGIYEIFATVSEEWQTQVFLVMEEFWIERVSFRVPSLRSASILMSRLGRGFDPYSETVRLSELARHALVQGRNVISSHLMKKLLSEKFDDPMLGIIAAHLILQKHRPDWQLLQIICNNLVNMLGEHPDVQALLIAMKDRSRNKVKSIDCPPTLWQSWKYIIKASRRRAALVLPGTPAAQIAEEVVRGGSWLIHRINEEYQPYPQENSSIAESVRIIEKLTSMNKADLKNIILQSISGEKGFTGLERSVLNAIGSYTKGISMLKEETKKSVQSKARQVLGDLPAPSYSIARAVINLADKMKIG